MPFMILSESKEERLVTNSQPQCVLLENTNFLHPTSDCHFDRDITSIIQRKIDNPELFSNTCPLELNNNNSLLASPPSINNNVDNRSTNHRNVGLSHWNTSLSEYSNAIYNPLFALQRDVSSFNFPSKGLKKNKNDTVARGTQEGFSIQNKTFFEKQRRPTGITSLLQCNNEYQTLTPEINNHSKLLENSKNVKMSKQKCENEMRMRPSSLILNNQSQIRNEKRCIGNSYKNPTEEVQNNYNEIQQEPNFFINYLTDSFLEKYSNVEEEKLHKSFVSVDDDENKMNYFNASLHQQSSFYNPENLQKMCQKIIVANDKNILPLNHIENEVESEAMTSSSSSSKFYSNKSASKKISNANGIQMKGLITTCTISDGIWDHHKLSWKEINKIDSYEHKKINSPTVDCSVNFKCKKYKCHNKSKQHFGYINPAFESFHIENETNFHENSDHFDQIRQESNKQQRNCQFEKENLGPEFFTKICNLWPDLIARLAHDINLDLMSPDDEPKPPDPPNDRPTLGGSKTTYWGNNNGLNNNLVPTTISNKCCSPQDPSCPQLPLDSIVENINLATQEEPQNLSGTNLEGNLSISVDNNRPSSVKCSPLKKTNENLLPKIKESSFETSTSKEPRNCQSPICGSPRPKQPVPHPGLTEQELLHLVQEAELEEDEVLETYIEEVEEELVDDVDVKLKKDEVIVESSTLEREPMINKKGDRTRRKLPEIPKDKKSFSSASILSLRTPTLAEEIQEAESGVGSRSSTPDGLSILNSSTKPLLVLKCHSYIRDDSCSPESEFCLPVHHDIDSGHSTQHSPDGAKSMSPQALRDHSPLSPSVGVPESHLELLEATHRGLYRFIPRHGDELEIEIGDPIYVQKEADDLWCEGVNLRTEKQGIFPAAHVTDVDYSDFDPTVPKVKKERYLLNYLGSIETLSHKGNQVLCQAVRKIAREDSGASSFQPHSCILEVSDQGIRMVDKSSPGTSLRRSHDYFYHLKHVSFCGFHPKDPRYFGFITKHPAVQRFACHVFESLDSTRPVAEAVGRAFHRFYKKFVEAAYPTEDIYIE